MKTVEDQEELLLTQRRPPGLPEVLNLEVGLGHRWRCRGWPRDVQLPSVTFCSPGHPRWRAEGSNSNSATAYFAPLSVLKKVSQQKCFGEMSPL